MKVFLKFLTVVILFITACKTDKKPTESNENQTEIATNFDTFGAVISADNALSSKEMLTKFNSLQVGDTINIKFASSIKEVCSKKGCWMKLPLDQEAETMVRFKDYGFFMPLDSKDREVIVEGKAFVTEVSVEDLKHYAEDAGKSAEEIAKITTPKKEFAFEANGVLMKK
ncbi:DUF4920 domain-containing protein [Polaribacter sp.]|uniref:DUF4920 domain-containing protein n=1 Tax=Polaribacter sp. TaxID=1920175 RepID=UPI0040481429